MRRKEAPRARGALRGRSCAHVHHAPRLPVGVLDERRGRRGQLLRALHGRLDCHHDGAPAVRNAADVGRVLDDNVQRHGAQVGAEYRRADAAPKVTVPVHESFRNIYAHATRCTKYAHYVRVRTRTCPMPYYAPFGLTIRDVRSSTSAPEECDTVFLRNGTTFVIVLRYSGIGRAFVTLKVDSVHVGDFVISFGRSAIDGSGGDSGRFAVPARGKVVAWFREEPPRYRSRKLSTTGRDAAGDLGPAVRLELQLRACAE